MGASLSSLTESESTANGKASLGDIPENCVACVFMFLNPSEICNLARLNRAFRGAASSDAVWDSKLPVNYHQLVEVLPQRSFEGKKDVFSFLSRPVTLDDGNKMWEDRVYDDLLLLIDPRFHAVAYCLQVWWFEVSGSVKFPFPPDIYTLTFRVHLGKFHKRLGLRVCNFEHTRGWDLGPVRYELFTSDGQQAVSEYSIHDCDQDDASAYIKRGNWIEYKVGEFLVSRSDPTFEIRFSMKQIDCTHSKGGLCVDSVLIAPSDLKVHRRKRVSTVSPV
ncbi:unnamed protein product [Withania somnifera]